MPAPFSVDLRQRIVDAYQAKKGSFKEVGAIFGVGEATVNRLVSRLRRTKSIEPSPHGGGQTWKIPDSELPKLIQLVEEQPDGTAAEWAKEYSSRVGVKVSRSAVIRSLARAGLTHKKRRSAQVSKTSRTSRLCGASI